MNAAGIRLAVLGDPLAFTLSPILHQAGLAALGLKGGSEAIRVSQSELGAKLDELEARNFRGVSLTHPLKESALDHVTQASSAAKHSRSVNTIRFGPEGRWGETTDGAGFLDLLESLDRDPKVERVVLLGGGGAARSLALALDRAGASKVSVSVRRPDVSGPAWQAIPIATLVGWRSADEQRALEDATLLINATPLSGGDVPIDVGRVPTGVLVVDLVYGPEPTPWVRALRASGVRAHDGLGLLVFQARRAIVLWLGLEAPIEPLAEAVGWPR